MKQIIIFSEIAAAVQTVSKSLETYTEQISAAITAKQLLKQHYMDSLEYSRWFSTDYGCLMVVETCLLNTYL